MIAHYGPFIYLRNRMDREAFWELHQLIRNDPVFISKGCRPQRPALIQLATFLCYVGGESGIKTAAFTATAEGTVWLYTRRVTRTVRKLRDQFISWPSNGERDRISARLGNQGFPGCLGSCDGSYLRSASKPKENGYAYYCHKGLYAVYNPSLLTINVCAFSHVRSSILCRQLATLMASSPHMTLDGQVPYRTAASSGFPIFGRTRRITFEIMSIYWLTKVFRHCYMFLNDALHDKPHSILGYPLTKYSIRPFHQHDLTNNPHIARHRKQWNRQLSRIRVRIEHVFGRLKGRFPYLRYCPGIYYLVFFIVFLRSLANQWSGKIGIDVQDVYSTIEALMIIHNFLEGRQDDPTQIPHFNGAEDEDVQEVLDEAFGGNNRVRDGEDDGIMHALGVYRRKELVRYYIEGENEV